MAVDTEDDEKRRQKGKKRVLGREKAANRENGGMHGRGADEMIFFGGDW